MRKSVLIVSVTVAVAMISTMFIFACGGGGGGGGNGEAPATKMAVALRGTGEIAIVDLTDPSYAYTRYSVGTGPQSIDISPDKSTFYITDNQNSSGPGILWVVNVADGAVISSIDTGGSVWGVKVHPDGSKVYVSDYANDEIAVIDTASYAVTTTISVGTTPVGLAISQDGSKLCVPNKSDDTVTIINTATGAAITSSVLGGSGSGPWEVAFSPDGSECWVDDSDSNGEKLTIVDTSDASIMASTTLSFFDTLKPGGLQGFSFTPDGTKAFVGSVYSFDMFVVDTTTLDTLAHIDTGTPDGGYAKRMAMDPSGDTLYYSTSEQDVNGDRIFIINVSDYSVASTTIDFAAGDKPNGLVLY